MGLLFPPHPRANPKNTATMAEITSLITLLIALAAKLTRARLIVQGLGLAGVTSPLHSLTLILANNWRKLVLTPGFDSIPSAQGGRTVL